MKHITIQIPLFMLWESARPFCLTSDDWSAAYTSLQTELKREIAEDGSTRVYQMLDACMQKLTEGGFLRKMTDAEIATDSQCPFYEEEHPRADFYDAASAIGVSLRGFTGRERLLILAECLSNEAQELNQQ